MHVYFNWCLGLQITALMTSFYKSAQCLHFMDCHSFSPTEKILLASANIICHVSNDSIESSRFWELATATMSFSAWLNPNGKQKHKGRKMQYLSSCNFRLRSKIQNKSQGYRTEYKHSSVCYQHHIYMHICIYKYMLTIFMLSNVAQ